MTIRRLRLDFELHQPRGRANEPCRRAYRAGEREIRCKESDEGRKDPLSIPIGWF